MRQINVKLDSDQRKLRDQMEIVAYRFLHAETYFRKSTGRTETFWVFSQNCYGEVACLLWCHLFNSYDNDPVHYKNLFGGDRLKILSPGFTYDSVKARLLKAASMDDASYIAYREQVKAFRDKFVAHREFLLKTIIFPDLKPASAMIQELRRVLEETVREELILNPSDHELQTRLLSYDDNQNQSVIFGCECNADDALPRT